MVNGLVEIPPETELLQRGRHHSINGLVEILPEHHLLQRGRPRHPQNGLDEKKTKSAAAARQTTPPGQGLIEVPPKRKLLKRGRPHHRLNEPVEISPKFELLQRGRPHHPVNTWVQLCSFAMLTIIKRNCPNSLGPYHTTQTAIKVVHKRHVFHFDNRSFSADMKSEEAYSIHVMPRARNKGTRLAPEALPSSACQTARVASCSAGVTHSLRGVISPLSRARCSRCGKPYRTAATRAAGY